MRNWKWILKLAFLCSGVVWAETAVPPLVNYQGMLTDELGNPVVDGSKKLEFRIYDAALDGAVVWGPQVFDNVPVVAGRFNVILGTTDSAGRSIASAFGADNRFLGFKVGDSGQVLDGIAEISPRQRILSAPYAVRAESAGRLEFPKQGADGGAVFFESIGGGAYASNTVLETIGSGDEGFVFRTKVEDTVREWGRLDERGLALGGNLSVSGQAVVAGGFNFNNSPPSTYWLSDNYEIRYDKQGDYTVNLGKHSFCALGKLRHDGVNGGWCEVWYDESAGSWMLHYTKWSGGGIGCKAVCF